jgi:hypothetical protein
VYPLGLDSYVSEVFLYIFSPVKTFSQSILLVVKVNQNKHRALGTGEIANNPLAFIILYVVITPVD